VSGVSTSNCAGRPGSSLSYCSLAAFPSSPRADKALVDTTKIETASAIPAAVNTADKADLSPSIELPPQNHSFANPRRAPQEACSLPRLVAARNARTSSSSQPPGCLATRARSTPSASRPARPRSSLERTGQFCLTFVSRATFPRLVPNAEYFKGIATDPVKGAGYWVGQPTGPYLGSLTELRRQGGLCRRSGRYGPL
jgi:hypothetical protein